MAQKKKTFSKVKAIKDAARVNIGAPKSTRAIPDAKKKAELRGEKHKKGLEDVLEEDAPEEDEGIGAFPGCCRSAFEAKRKPAQILPRELFAPVSSVSRFLVGELSRSSSPCGAATVVVQSLWRPERRW